MWVNNMNIKLKRAVRTPHSEEIDIFDGDIRDENDDAVSIGKLEVHYLNDQVVGTLLIWEEFVQGYNRTQGTNVLMDDLIEAILAEVTEPIGVAAEYGIEIYFPSVLNHSFASRYSDSEQDTAYEAGSEGAEDEEYEEDDQEDDRQESAEEGQPRDDDFYRKLTQRP
jgi:hypothetical protein